MSDQARARGPAGLRWRCRGTGDCCRSGFALGPVEETVIDGLKEADIEALWPPAAAGWLEQRPGPDGRSWPFLHTRDGACVFLRDDDLCAIHALLGASAKPGFCREFPYNVVMDPVGAAVVVRPSCSGFGASFADAPEVTGLEEVVALPRVVPRQHFAPDAVAVLPGATVDLATWMGWEAELLGLLEEPGEPEVLAARVRERLEHLTRSPLPPRPEQAEAGFLALITVLQRVMGQVLATPGGAEHQVRFARARVADLDRALLAREAPLRPLDDDARGYVALLMRSHLLSKQFAAWGGVADGLGLVLLGLRVVRSSEMSDGPLGSAELGERYAAWTRFEAITPITRILQRARVALRDLFLHCPASPTPSGSTPPRD